MPRGRQPPDRARSPRQVDQRDAVGAVLDQRTESLVLLADAPRYPVYNSGGTPISLGDLAEIVREFLPEAQMTFANDGGIEESGNYLVDNSRLRQEFEVEYPPFRSRVLDIINDIRRQEGLPQVQGR